MAYDNVDVAILTMVNALAQRYGVRPIEFVATLNPSEDESRGAYELAYEDWPDGESLPRFVRMLRSLGIEEGGSLIGTEGEIYDALEKAVQVAPTGRRR